LFWFIHYHSHFSSSNTSRITRHRIIITYLRQSSCHQHNYIMMFTDILIQNQCFNLLHISIENFILQFIDSKMFHQILIQWSKIIVM
jgi:hypothetical protein